MYTAEQEALGEYPCMEMVAMGPEIYDAEIRDHLSPIMNPVIDWLHQRLTPEEIVNG